MPDGSVYIGEFKDDQICGKGALIYTNGSLNYSDWIDNRKEGIAVFKWFDGTHSYYGEYQDDLKHGKGVYFYEDGRITSGAWQKGKLHGINYVVSPNGKVIRKCSFFDGKRI